jgi:hypothetical protein
MIGPKLFTLTFAAVIGADRADKVPGAPFLLSSLLLVVSFGLAWRANRSHPAASRLVEERSS